MSTKPTVLIFHGSWHQPVHYQKLVKGLEGAGFETLIPLLPSFNAQPHIGVAKDTEYLRRVLEDLLAKGKQVLILGHSYGGMMCADVVLPIHTLRCRSLAGFPGGVIGTIYLAGWLLLPGESLASALSGGILPPFIPIDAAGKSTFADPRNRFYNDLSDAEAAEAVALLRPSPAVTQLEPITNASYLYTPTMFIYLEDDGAMIPPMQKHLVKKLETLGVKFTFATIKSSHSPFLSCPEKVVEIAQKFVEDGAWKSEDLSSERRQLEAEFGAMMASLGPPPS